MRLGNGRLRMSSTEEACDNVMEFVQDQAKENEKIPMENWSWHQNAPRVFAHPKAVGDPASLAWCHM